MPEPLTVEERLQTVEDLLRKLEGSIGVNDAPSDPERAWHYERSLLAHFSDMHRSFHDWRNTSHVMLGVMDRLKDAVESSAAISRQNSEGIKQIAELTQHIEEVSRSISNGLGLVTREKPLLMRDLFWLETNPVEIGLLAYAFGEAWVFLRGSDDLMKTPTYRGLSLIMSSPQLWGGMLGIITITAMIAFMCRRRKWRMVGAFGMAMYFGLAGIMTLYISSSVLGWWPHMLAALGAFWILARGPSDAPK
jgi:hypothetical protein